MHIFITRAQFHFSTVFFQELQSDYKRFMDYTGGQFHSDYLMRLRYLGMKLADKDVPSLQTYDSFYEEHRVT